MTTLFIPHLSMVLSHRHGIAAAAVGLVLLLSQAPLLSAFDLSDTPSFAESERRIVTTFTKPGPLGSGILSEDQFDFQAFTTHQCFQPVGDGEWTECVAMFGPYANLRDTLDSGKLKEILKRPVPQYGQVPASEKTGDVRGELFENERIAQVHFVESLAQLRDFVTRQERARLLWSLCKQRVQPAFTGTCFQQNLRLSKMTQLDLARNLHISF